MIMKANSFEPKLNFKNDQSGKKNEYSIPAERQVERADGLFGREEVRLGSDCSEGKGRVDGVSKTFAQNTEHIHNLEF